jgi:VWFA-related protein
MVPVVVRDAHGNVVSDLRKEDFTLLDNDKPQEITSFRVEKPGQRLATRKPLPEANGAGGEAQTENAKGAPMVIPDHFAAYVFDDLSFQESGDLVWVRDGAMRHMATLQPGDRAAVFTTSCTTQLEFTDDRAKLRDTISKLQFRPHSVCREARSAQPPSVRGGGPVPTAADSAQFQLQGFLDRIVERMSTLPGQRSVVFVSYGMALDPRVLHLLADYAIRSRVVIHTLNARALHPTTPGADSSLTGNAQQMESAIQGQALADLSERLGLSALAYATGGTFVENTNDADGAYRRMATPECTYMLGFSPGDANLDGKLHHLKVTLKEPRKLNLQARTSYYAATPAQQQEALTAPAAPLFVASEAEAKEVEETIGIGQSQPSESQPATFKAKVNLVLVPVVVRDSQGHAVGNLTKDDFQLFDRGKLQEIRQFAVEKPGQHVALEKPVEGAEEAGVNENEVGALQKHAAPMVIPDRFVALVFDDYHLKMGGMDKFDSGYLIWARDAARRYIATLKPSDRVAILTTTGETALDFTSDRAKLEQALLKLHPSQDRSAGGMPSVLFPSGQAHAPVFDQSGRQQEWEGRRSLEELQAIVQRMSAEPGQRTMVLLSQGFQIRNGPNWDLLPDTMSLIDRSIQSNVVINTLNVRGLEPLGNGPDELLFVLADGTGGTYIRDRNDYDSALHQLADAPEYRYVLGFSPENLKQDGSLHNLKVSLKDGHGLDVQARRAYWDAKPAKETVQTARRASQAPQESKAEEKEMAETLGIAPPVAAPPGGPLVAKTEMPSLAPAPPASANAAEVTSHDQAVTFQSKVNLVMVPVVVRDANGHAVGNLKKDDFQLFDKGKRQQITKFTVEKAGGQAAVAAKPAASVNPEDVQAGKQPEQPVAVPENFVAYLFDDIHLKFGDLGQVRDAAGRNIDTLQPADRAAIFATSGQGALDFTDDHAKLHAALLKLRSRPLTGSGVQECPDVSYYMGDLIANKNDQQALSVATQETIICMSLPPQAAAEAQNIARSAAQRAVSNGEHESQVSLITLKEAVRRISVMPGQRNLIIVSPGFLALESLLPEELDVVERAIRSNVRISSLDARGLYTLDPAGDISQRQYSEYITRMKAQYYQQEAMASSAVLAEMAAGTGGTFIQNTNDFDGGFRRLATAPEYVYMIGFAPENLKPDGSFHALKVKLSSAEKLSLQARHGYFAPKRAESELAVAKEEVESAVFSREEIHELPVELHTQFFKPSDTEAKLKVLASVDLKQLQFRKDEGRNRNDLTVVSALFDNNGNFVAGLEKIVHMRFLDTSMERIRQAPPIKVISSFDVKPGSYLIRLVVRDAEGHLMATENGAVEIP